MTIKQIRFLMFIADIHVGIVMFFKSFFSYDWFSRQRRKRRKILCELMKTDDGRELIARSMMKTNMQLIAQEQEAKQKLLDRVCDLAQKTDISVHELRKEFKV